MSIISGGANFEKGLLCDICGKEVGEGGGGGLCRSFPGKVLYL